MANITISVLIVNYNTAHLLSECLGKLRLAAAEASVHLDLLIVDNASRDDSREVLKKHYSDCTLIFNDVNVGFGRANNQLLPYIKGEYVLLLNTDAFVDLYSIKKSLRFLADNKSCGLVGARLLSRDGTVQASARYFPTPLKIFLNKTGLNKKLNFLPRIDPIDLDFSTPKECDWVPGCYYLMRRDIVDQLGLFDKRFFLYYEEVDHCFLIRNRGWRIFALHDVNVVHIGGESAKSDGIISNNGRQLESLLIESEQLYFRKNLGISFLIFHVILDFISDFLIFIKSGARGRAVNEIRRFFVRQSLVVSSLVNTRFGLKPTR